ncbi:hypothetical protein SNEBB_001546 [Seison nebaliae]|nr:hypothetical protein SNEBB_001546 [Seison nebaliae]
MIDKSCVSELVDRILNSWSAVKIVKDNQMGGRQTLIKLEELKEKMIFVLQQPKLDVMFKYDFPEWLDEFFDTNFDVLLEDESHHEIAETLQKIQESSTDPIRLKEIVDSLLPATGGKEVIDEVGGEIFSDE